MILTLSDVTIRVVKGLLSRTLAAHVDIFDIWLYKLTLLQWQLHAVSAVLWKVATGFGRPLQVTVRPVCYGTVVLSVLSVCNVGVL